MRLIMNRLRTPLLVENVNLNQTDPLGEAKLLMAAERCWGLGC